MWVATGQMVHWSSSTLRQVRWLSAHIALVGSSCSLSNFFFLFPFFFSFLLFYLFPFITIIILYSAILRSLKKRSKPGELLQGQGDAKRHQQNQKIMKILISIVVAFFICWTPLSVYLFLKKLYPSLFIKDRCLLLVGLTFYVFPSFSTAVNPIILFVFSTNFKRALKNLWSSVFFYLGVHLQPNEQDKSK